MKLSIVIPTRGDQNMKNIIACLFRQTFKDFEVIFVVDKNLKDVGEFTSQDKRIHYITNLNSSFRTQRDDKEPMIGGNASTLRNYGIKSAHGEFILLMDDDELFEDNYLEKNISLRSQYRPIIKKDFVLTPTLMYRKTLHIQNQ
jgi:glycosyltransferase involved in cell wall biosynthesis